MEIKKRTRCTTSRKVASPAEVRKSDLNLQTTVTNGTKINKITTAKSTESVVIMFAARRGLRSVLPNGHIVYLAGNAIDLHGKPDGVLPFGGFSLNIIDKADWDLWKQVYGKAYRPWFDSGKIIEQRSERVATTLAADNADVDAGDNPITPAQMKTEPVPKDEI